MAVKVTVECEGGNILASIQTERPDIAAQLVYEATKTAINDQCEECSIGLVGLLDSMIAQAEATQDQLDFYGEDFEDDFGAGAMTAVPSEPGFDPRLDEDPNYYGTRNNGLTVEESADRAAQKVTDILEREGVVDENEYFDLIKPVCEQAIASGLSRRDLYQLAGRIGKEVREEDLYLGIPIAMAFKYKANTDLGVSSS